MRYILLFLIFFGFTSLVTAQDHQLTVIISGINKVKGELIIGLFDNKSAWLKKGKEFSEKTIEIKSKEETIIFDNLPDGEYGVSVYHDQNSDGKCNRSIIGYPVEGFGFSRDARVFVKAPGFKKASFSVTGNSTENITLRYKKDKDVDSGNEASID